MLDGLSTLHRNLRRAVPDVYQGFGELHKAAFAPGALDTRTKELIALAIGVVRNCHAESTCQVVITSARLTQRLVLRTRPSTLPPLHGSARRLADQGCDAGHGVEVHGQCACHQA